MELYGRTVDGASFECLLCSRSFVTSEFETLCDNNNTSAMPPFTNKCDLDVTPKTLYSINAHAYS